MDTKETVSAGSKRRAATTAGGAAAAAAAAGAEGGGAPPAKHARVDAGTGLTWLQIYTRPLPGVNVALYSYHFDASKHGASGLAAIEPFVKMEMTLHGTSTTASSASSNAVKQASSYQFLPVDVYPHVCAKEGKRCTGVELLGDVKITDVVTGLTLDGITAIQFCRALNKPGIPVAIVMDPAVALVADDRRPALVAESREHVLKNVDAARRSDPLHRFDGMVILGHKEPALSFTTALANHRAGAQATATHTVLLLDSADWHHPTETHYPRYPSQSFVDILLSDAGLSMQAAMVRHRPEWLHTISERERKLLQEHWDVHAQIRCGVSRCDAKDDMFATFHSASRAFDAVYDWPLCRNTPDAKAAMASLSAVEHKSIQSAWAAYCTVFDDPTLKVGKSGRGQLIATASGVAWSSMYGPEPSSKSALQVAGCLCEGATDAQRERLAAFIIAYMADLVYARTGKREIGVTRRTARPNASGKSLPFTKRDAQLKLWDLFMRKSTDADDSHGIYSFVFVRRRSPAAAASAAK
jgi:hypothetical protein